MVLASGQHLCPVLAAQMASGQRSRTEWRRDFDPRLFVRQIRFLYIQTIISVPFSFSCNKVGYRISVANAPAPELLVRLATHLIGAISSKCCFKGANTMADENAECAFPLPRGTYGICRSESFASGAISFSIASRSCLA